MGKILPFIYKGIDVTQLELVDDYYIMLDELSELSEISEKQILKDIDKGILKADKINGDLLVPMDMAQNEFMEVTWG